MPPEGEHDSAEAPVRRIAPDEGAAGPEQGIALCLSGGGYRAMLFHLGALWRLHDVGLLERLDRVSSVSGGSITAAQLALWIAARQRSPGTAADFRTGVVAPIRALADRTIDRSAILFGMAGPGSIGDKISDAYRKHLFGEATLQQPPDRPRFVINATNVQSGALWRFSKPYMADWRVGRVDAPDVTLADAVAASTAFPPALSPVELSLRNEDFVPGSGSDLQRPPYTTDVVLTDGGVYDNLGLETAWKRYRTILVSDGGGQLEPEPEPKRDWARHAYRVLGLIDNQVRALRKRRLIEALRRGDRTGTYWGIRTSIADYGLPDALPCPLERTLALARTPTRLKRLEPVEQERLVNWGFAVCDAALRRHFDPGLLRAAGFPYPPAAV